MHKSLTSALIAIATISATSAFSETNASGGSAFFIGKTIKPSEVPKNTDISKASYGNDYYYCGGASIKDQATLSITFLRKGVKTDCLSQKQTVSITEPSSDNKSHTFFDSMDIAVPKGYALMNDDCTGGQVVITKMDNKEFHTGTLRAWNIVDKKFVPVADLKSIKCMNQSFGE